MRMVGDQRADQDHDKGDGPPFQALFAVAASGSLASFFVGDKRTACRYGETAPAARDVSFPAAAPTFLD
jgi:hypothetical protein